MTSQVALIVAQTCTTHAPFRAVGAKKNGRLAQSVGPEGGRAQSHLSRVGLNVGFQTLLRHLQEERDGTVGVRKTRRTAPKLAIK
jgi:hypothetical protein